MSPTRRPEPWSVDRYGRLIAGAAILASVACMLLRAPWGLWIAAGIGLQLLFGSLVNRCAVHALLVRLGAREREDLFLPGGEPRAARPAPIRNGSTQEGQRHACHER